MDSSQRLSLMDPMRERADISSRIVQGLVLDHSAVSDLLEQVVNTRCSFESGHNPIFRKINDSVDLSKSAGYPIAAKAIFSEIIAKQTGEPGELEGQITPAELKLISVSLVLNVQILSPKAEGSATVMDVWRSQPDNPAGLITVVHSGGQHWERWQ